MILLQCKENGWIGHRPPKLSKFLFLNLQWVYLPCQLKPRSTWPQLSNKTSVVTKSRHFMDVPRREFLHSYLQRGFCPDFSSGIDLWSENWRRLMYVLPLQEGPKIKFVAPYSYMLKQEQVCCYIPDTDYWLLKSWDGGIGENNVTEFDDYCREPGSEVTYRKTIKLAFMTSKASAEYCTFSSGVKEAQERTYVRQKEKHHCWRNVKEAKIDSQMFLRMDQYFSKLYTWVYIYIYFEH
jgi:hypothetical protein